MFERFTENARRVVVLAQEEARLLRHNYIGTEHLILGITSDEEGPGFKMLDSLEISPDNVRTKVMALVRAHAGETMGGHIPFTPRAKTVLEFSLREALYVGHNWVGPEHILLELVREGEGVAAQVLRDCGADLDALRQYMHLTLPGQKPQDISSELTAIRKLLERHNETMEGVAHRLEQLRVGLERSMEIGTGGGDTPAPSPSASKSAPGGNDSGKN